jgi:acetyltransferase
MRFPVVAKIVSPDITHKTSVGGVRLGLRNPQEVYDAVSDLLAAVARARPDATIEGVLVEEQLQAGIECILGIVRDSPVGPVVAFGAGGLAVEREGNVVFRLAPIDRTDALEMLSIARGMAALPSVTADIAELLVQALLALGRLMAEDPTIGELEINPLLVLPGEIVAVDAVVRRYVPPADSRTSPSVGEAVMDGNIDPLMAPTSVAIIGASTNPAKPGTALMRNVVAGGYAGRIYPVNLHATEILGHRAYPSIEDVPEPVDIAFVAVPREAVLAALEGCARKGVRSAVVITAGYSEVGGSGAKDEARIAKLARGGGMRVIGPNTIGMVCTPCNLIATFVPFDHWEDGDVAIFAQTGIFAGAPHAGLMAQPFQRLGVRFSIDAGNKPDVDEIDFLAYVADRPDVGVIGLYLESLRNPERFLSVASQVKSRKPIVVLKPGRTRAGAAASASHTGSMAMDDRVLDAGLEQCGLVRAVDYDDFITLLRAFSWRTAAVGPRLGIVTHSGALGIIAADEAIEHGLEIAKWAADTRARLQAVLPEWQPVADPVDLGAVFDGPHARWVQEEALDASLSDTTVDAVLAIVLATPGAEFEGIREAFAGLRDRHPSKPLLLVVYGGSSRDHWMRELEGLQIPVFGSSNAALRALSAVNWYEASKDRLHPSLREQVAHGERA